MFQVTKEEWNALRSQIVTLEDLKSQNVISNAVDKDTNERHLIIICEIREIRCLKGGRLKCYFLPLSVTFPMFGEQNRW